MNVPHYRSNELYRQRPVTRGLLKNGCVSNNFNLKLLAERFTAYLIIRVYKMSKCVVCFLNKCMMH